MSKKTHVLSTGGKYFIQNLYKQKLFQDEMQQKWPFSWFLLIVVEFTEV